MPGRKARKGYGSKKEEPPQEAAAPAAAAAEDPDSPPADPAPAPAPGDGGGAAAGGGDDGAPPAAWAKAKPEAAAKQGADDSDDEAGGDDDSDDDDDDGDGGAALAAALSKRPLVVEYCPTCSFPAEFCEYSGTVEECKEWAEAQLVKEGLSGVSLEEKGKKKKKKDAPDGEQQLPGGKKKKKAAQEVVISVAKRGGRKHITTVKGLDAFGHQLDEVAKQFKKKFSCGCTVASQPGMQSGVEIQGDKTSEVLEMLPGKYKVPTNAIFRIVDKEKVRVKYSPEGEPLLQP